MKRYRVTVPRKYVKDGEERTHFWPVGVAWPLKEKDGFSVELYTNVLPTKKLVVLLDEPRQSSGTNDADPELPGDDDIPF